ncbi:MAG: MBL fold metallo-hydrolase, partial [Deferribacteres bacterium]|nr:MBL fold metallo-hydrolase [Deferribacteres bacterium]
MLLKNKCRVERVVLPTPYPIGEVYSYVILDEPVTIVDAGVYTDEIRRIWDERLRTLGLTFRDVKRIYLTHGHSDHYGFARVFAELSGAKVYLHPWDFDKVKDRREYYMRVIPFFRMFGVPEDYIDYFVQVIAWESPFCKALDEDCLVAVGDGDRLEFEGFSFEIVHVPGHSPGHTILLLEDEAITGDFIFTSLTPDPIIDVTRDGKRVKSMLNYCESLKKMRDRGLKVFYPAHREFKGSYIQALDNLMARFRDKSRLIIAALKEKGRLTPFELARAIYPDMKKAHIYIVMSEIMGRLDILEDKGKVRCFYEDGLLYYSAL